MPRRVPHWAGFNWIDDRRKNMTSFFISMILLLWALVFAAFYAMALYGAVMALAGYLRQRLALLKQSPAFPSFSTPRPLRESGFLPSACPVISVRPKVK